MKRCIELSGLVLALAMMGRSAVLNAQEKAPAGNFYEKSLHYTNRGLEHWYAKENGGLERIVGVPFSKLACNNCHVRTCDDCHAKVVGGKAVYSVETAKTEAACEKCHAMEIQAFSKKNPEDAAADVHFARGMKCMDCHSSREIHGDGTQYDSMQAAGLLETRCENCHKDLSKCPSNAVHAGKVDCSACHVRDVPSCYNCHFDTKVKEGKSVSIPLNKMLFLVNHNGKVTLGNLHTFIYQNRTMIVFAPSFPHWIMKEGRKCGDCHGTQLVQSMSKKNFRPVVWEGGQLKNAGGIIPVLDGFNWNFVFLNYSNEKWAPAENAAAPILNYSGYCKPITQEQLAKIAKPQSP